MPQDGLSTLSQPPQIDFSSSAGMMKGLQALQGQESALDAQRQKSIQPAMQKFETEMAKPKPEAPTPPEAGKPPQAGFGNAGPEFFAAIAVFAGLASALSRRHATNALTAFGSAVQGLVKGDMTVFDHNYKTWKAETDSAQQEFQNRLTAYDEAINNRKLAADDLKNELLLASIRYDDKAMQGAKDDIFKMLNIRDRENEASVRLAEAAARLEETKAKADEQMMEKLGVTTEQFGKIQAEAKEEAGPNAKPEQIAALVKQKLATVQGSGGVGSSDIDQARGAMVASGVPAATAVPGWGKAATDERKQAQQDAIRIIMQQNPDMTAADAGVELARRQVEYMAGKTSVTQLNTMLGATRQAVAQLDFNIDKAQSEMKRLGSSDISPVINAIARGEEKWTGNPAYSSLYFYMNAVATESARILAGGQASRAQLHVGAMEEAQKWANINMTPASFADVAKSMHDEGEARLRTFEDAKKAQQIGGAPTQAGAPAAQPGAGTGKFVEGQVYQDAQGNKARYQGGQWVPVQ